MKLNKKIIKKYFEENAPQWVLDGYSDDRYNYPVGLHRARLVSKFFLTLKKKNLMMADLGCGAGNLSFILAGQGHRVIGIDQSEEMHKLAQANLAKVTAPIKERVKFLCRPLEKNGLKSDSFDAVISMGVIGYLPSDPIIFSTAKKLLKPGGYFLVSCRNRLFNLASIGFRTKSEVKNGMALKLIQEFEELDKNIPSANVAEFIKKIKELSKSITPSQNMLSPSEKHGMAYTSLIEPRQHTPKQLNAVAKKFGFRDIRYFGIHPHLINPQLNKFLPPKIFNSLSEPLEAFEQLPISLSWSSVFIGVFQKQKYEH